MLTALVHQRSWGRWYTRAPRAACSPFYVRFRSLVTCSRSRPRSTTPRAHKCNKPVDHSGQWICRTCLKIIHFWGSLISRFVCLRLSVALEGFGTCDINSTQKKLAEPRVSVLRYLYIDPASVVTSLQSEAPRARGAKELP